MSHLKNIIIITCLIVGLFMSWVVANHLRYKSLGVAHIHDTWTGRTWRLDKFNKHKTYTPKQSY